MGHVVLDLGLAGGSDAVLHAVRWAGSSIFYPPPAPIFMGRMWVAQLLFLQGFVVSIAVVTLGFMYANHPWLLLIGVIVTALWAMPPHRGMGPATPPFR